MNRFPVPSNLKRLLQAGLTALLLIAALEVIAGPRNGHGRPPGAPGCFEPSHFILVHGAWHGGWAWYKIKTQLEAAGHTVTVVDLPSHGIDRTPPETVTLQDYTNRVIEAIDQAGEPVILVGHSMGGIVISTAAEARPDSVDKLVYVAALLLENGVSVFDIVAMDPDSPIVADMIPGDGIVDINRDDAVELFYNMSPRSDINLAESLMVVNPMLPMVTPISVTEENFGSIHRYYITTAYDNAIPPDIQEYMYTTLPCDEVFAIDSDHSPFFSRPAQLTSILKRIADR
jgi:pimeloyl-ACP methyl ester carboxylesterase